MVLTCLDDIIKNEIDGLRPDGKVYVTIKYTKNHINA